MRFSQFFVPTLRELSADVEMVSHRLLLRAGYIRQLSAGVYSYLPLGWRVLRKVEAIIREEMDAVGAQEILMPALHPQELWAESGREAGMKDVLMPVKDRRGGAFYLGPTHEEVVTDLVRKAVRSYRDLPLNLYQIQTKFRDEPRPRGGLVRAREFIMKDAYSFDYTDEGLDKTYNRMYDAYISIFKRIGLPVIAVEASGGAIGGKETKEFMHLTESGEDSILICPTCGYAANREIADFQNIPWRGDETPRPSRRVATPEAHTVGQVCGFLGVPAARLVKTLIYLADGRPVAALVRGDRELNEGRFRVLLGAATLVMATPEEIEAATGGPVGFSGPVGLQVPLYVDDELLDAVNFVVGANAADVHIVDVNWSDVASRWTASRLRFAEEGDACDRCGTPFKVKRGIEMGHIFKLRTAISRPMLAMVTGENGVGDFITMGCYGMGVSRILSAVAEWSHDENGLIWPAGIAPFDAHLILANPADETQRALAEQVYTDLQAVGVDVLYDERPERAGVKFKDADLIGVPVRIVVGKLAGEGRVEVRARGGGSTEVVAVAELATYLKGSQSVA